MAPGFRVVSSESIAQVWALWRLRGWVGVRLATRLNQLGVSEARRVVAHVAAWIRLGPLALHHRLG